MDRLKKVRIIALHLGFGGIEKAICSMANLFAERCEVEILSVYKMQDIPAFPLDERVSVRYLLDEVPNREAWKKAVADRNVSAAARESLRAVRILRGKKRAVVNAIREAKECVVITTRPEDNVLLSRYGSAAALKIAQLHQDHRFDPELVRSFRQQYAGIDVFTLLTPGLADEVREIMSGSNTHTRIEYIPNFLEHFPENPELRHREKTVVAVGRLHEVKRFDLLIRHMHEVHERFPDWKLRIVGDGEERERLEALIRDLDASSYVYLAGRKDSKGVEEEMLKASLYAMTSASEGFPFVLLEAQSCALPILAYDVRVGPGFVVRDGKTGFLVREGDEAGFTEKLAELMGSPALCRKMSKAAAEDVKQFSRENVGSMWFKLLGAS